MTTPKTPAQPQAPAKQWRSPRLGLTIRQLLLEAASSMKATDGLSDDLHAAYAYIREHPPEVAVPLREERDAERAKVAERDARIATLEETIRKAPHAYDCLTRLRVCIGKSCTCWKRDFEGPMPSLEEIAAAFGAPEGQPRDYDPMTAPVPEGDMNGPHGPIPAPEGQPHAPPRKAPQEDALRWLAVQWDQKASEAEDVNRLSALRTCARELRAALAVQAPSSPTEQLSGKESK